MSKETLVFVVGVIVFFVPFLGVPSEYKKWILVVSGIALLIVGYSLRRRAFLLSIEHRSGERRADGFIESAVPPTQDKYGEKETEVQSV